MIGLGPLTVALALALNITGILAKVYSELWDGVDERRYAQVSSLGGGRLATFLYGIRPLASRNVLSFTLMWAECAIRNAAVIGARSEEHTSELQSLMRISYAVFCLKKTKTQLMHSYK